MITALSPWRTASCTCWRSAVYRFFAQGAAQAIEDGAVLALCLAEAPDNPTAALGRY
ncbi:hypothetical protein [Streptomyces bottropensis]|uniref:hypothetical protein n=1 Tax=Streptomyces bottropensis TaxID=42235 RepID=UPI00368DED2F